MEELIGLPEPEFRYFCVVYTCLFFCTTKVSVLILVLVFSGDEV